MKLSSLLLCAPLAALVSLAIGLPALPLLAIATVAFLLALTLQSYQAPRVCSRTAPPARSRRLAPRSRRARFPLAA